MADTAGSGESGGVTGQDSEADTEPPHQVSPVPDGYSLEVGETPGEGAPTSAKRLKLSEEEQGLDQVADPLDMHGDTPAQALLMQEDRQVQSRVSFLTMLYLLYIVKLVHCLHKGTFCS